LRSFCSSPQPSNSVTADQARVARRAYRTYGRGNHPAGLNFGNCFAYALAQTTGLPLLFKGDDFAQTDVAPAVVMER
jgi:ribonuclease VapC